MLPATSQHERPPRRVCAVAANALFAKVAAPERELDIDVEVNSESAQAAPRPHRKRGRPRKSPSRRPCDAATQLPKRRRGRPRRICVVATDKNDLAAGPDHALYGPCIESLLSLGLPATFALTPLQSGAASPLLSWPRRASLEILSADLSAWNRCCQ